MDKPKLQWIEEGIAFEEMEKKSRGWELIKQFINRKIKKSFNLMLKDEANVDKLRGQIKLGKEILNYPKTQISIAKDKKKELDEESKAKK